MTFIYNSAFNTIDIYKSGIYNKYIKFNTERSIKMSLKKAISILTVASVLLVSAGCSNINDKPTTTADSTYSTTSQSTESSSSEITKTESTEESSTTEIESGENTSNNQSTDENQTTSNDVSESSGDKVTGRSFSKRVELPSILHSYLKPGEQKQGEAFFDDAVFVGDSVTLGLKNYVTNERNAGRSCLGKAQFLCSGSMSYTNSRAAVGTKNSIHPVYRGKEMTIEDAVKASGAKKVFIMLGMNDFYGYPQGTGIKNAKDTIEKIQKVNPGIRIYVESVTPITKSKVHDGFNNDAIDAFNLQLKVLCNEYDLVYVDVASSLKNSDNCLKDEYCGDPTGMGIHMSYPGCKAWIEFLVSNF